MRKEKFSSQNFEVKDYQFMNLVDTPLPDGSVSEFKFSGIEDAIIVDKKQENKEIRIERESAKINDFTISPITREYRGIDKQIEDDRDLRITSEVDRRLIKLHEEATFSGYNEGVEKGKQDIYEQTRNSCEEKVALLTSMISDVIKTREKLMEKQRLDIYETIRNLTKWIILRELKDDGDYIKRLLEKLILDIHTTSDLVVHIDQKNFETMPDVLEIITKKLGELTNIRVEIDYDIEGPGIVLDSNNGIINGTLKEQFVSLDELFSNIDLPLSRDFSLLRDEEKEIAQRPFDNIDEMATEVVGGTNEEAIDEIKAEIIDEVKAETIDEVKAETIDEAKKESDEE